MKKVIVFMLIIIPMYTMSSIYVGDKIPLRIKATVIEDEVRNAFNEFYIEELEDMGEYYDIVVRPLKPGQFKLRIGRSELTIKVLATSTGEEFKEEMLGGINLLPKKPIFPYYILLPLLLLVPVIKFWPKSNKKPKTILPEEEFLEVYNGQQEDLFQLSLALRRYIDKKRQSNLACGDFEISDERIRSFLLSVEELKYHRVDYNYEDIKKEAYSIFSSIREEADV